MRKLFLPLVILCLVLLAAGCAGRKKIIKPAVEPEIKEVSQGVEPKAPEPAKQPEVISQPVVEKIVLEMIHFEFDKYRLLPEAKAVLERNAEILKTNPAAKVTIEGHCDERGTIEYNLALGEKRANAAEKYLIDLGISPGRISTISYGKERPLDPGSNEGAWAKNRRDEFKIVD